MPADVYIRPRAWVDVIEHGVYIGEEDPDVAARFIDAVIRAFDALAVMPNMGAPRQFRNHALKGIRMWPVKGFEKHLIFYRPVKGGIEVIRVLHSARDLEAIFLKEKL